MSTREQNEARQWIALREAGVPEKNILLEFTDNKPFRLLEHFLLHYIV